MEEEGKRRKVSVCEDDDGAKDQDKTVISKLMQRFRPIAPKPAVGESSDDTNSSKFLGRNKRSKRKYVRVRNRNTISSGSNNIGDKIERDLGKEMDGEDRVTLQLLPEKDLDLNSECVGISSSSDRTVVESWLTVECVGTDMGGCQKLELGHMDEGMLEADTCPWLVSDGSNRVYWINRAYRRMMGDPDPEVNIRVGLVVAMDLMKEITCMLDLYGAVTCRVRVRYGSGSEVVPCDVRRMGSSGGFAWRLDVESALRLGM